MASAHALVRAPPRSRPSGRGGAAPQLLGEASPGGGFCAGREQAQREQAQRPVAGAAPELGQELGGARPSRVLAPAMYRSSSPSSPGSLWAAGGWPLGQSQTGPSVGPASSASVSPAGAAATTAGSSRKRTRRSLTTACRTRVQLPGPAGATGVSSCSSGPLEMEDGWGWSSVPQEKGSHASPLALLCSWVGVPEEALVVGGVDPAVQRSRRGHGGEGGRRSWRGESDSEAAHLGSGSCTSGRSVLRARWILCGPNGGWPGSGRVSRLPASCQPPLTWLVCSQYCSPLALRTRGSARW